AHWTAEQDALLGTMRDEQIAQRLHRTPAAVEGRRLKLGIFLPDELRARRAPFKWTTRELSLLGRVSDDEAARRIGCTPAMAHKKRLKLRIPLQRDLLQVKPWTSEEERLVGIIPDKELAARLGRTVVSIRHRRKQLGRPFCNPTFQRWTEEELTLLGKLSDEEVARQTGHPLSSVVQKRHELGVPNLQPKRRSWQPQEDAALGTATD